MIHPGKSDQSDFLTEQRVWLGPAPERPATIDNHLGTALLWRSCSTSMLDQIGKTYFFKSMW